MRLNNIVYSTIVMAIFSHSLSAMEKEQENSAKGLNVAVFGGGGVNSYASMIIAEQFMKSSNQSWEKLFDESWCIAGGCNAAAALFKGKNADHYRNALTEHGKAFISANNERDKRQVLKGSFEKFFGAETKVSDKIVMIGSASTKPVYLSSRIIDPAALRCSPDTLLSDAILASSCFETPNDGFMYEPTAMKVMTGAETQAKSRIVVDGAHCKQELIDGFTPTPLVLDYLAKIPGKHNVVVFGNGGPINQQFRKKTKAKLGTASINNTKETREFYKIGDSAITIYFIDITVDNFMINSANVLKEHLDYLKAQANHVCNTSVFKQAQTTISKSRTTK